MVLFESKFAAIVTIPEEAMAAAAAAAACASEVAAADEVTMGSLLLSGSLEEPLVRSGH